MAELEIEIYFAEHQGAMTGKDAGEYLYKSMDSAAETRQLIENSYRNTQDTAQVFCRALCKETQVQEPIR